MMRAILAVLLYVGAGQTCLYIFGWRWNTWPSFATLFKFALFWPGVLLKEMYEDFKG